MLEEKSKKYELELKQIKSLMNETLKLLPEEEQKQVDKDIYYDSRSDNDPQYIGTCLHTKEFYMYYSNKFRQGAVSLDIYPNDPAVGLDIYPDKTMYAYAIHRGQFGGDLSINGDFKGSLKVLDDVLPSSCLKKVISQ